MDIIKINNLTKDYGNKKGIFNVNISIKKGEVFGFLGPNGAGKTTTIRNLMGFIRPDSGTCSILGMDCFKESEKIKEKLGYLAGEIAFFDDLTGIKLLNFLADMKGIKDKRKMNFNIEQIIKTIKTAGEIILTAHEQEYSVTAKEGKKNFVTKYDVAVQEYLFKELAKIVPEAEFVGEEGDSNKDTTALRFIIDPIDGTTNFMQDYRCSCISVAIC